MGLVNKVVIPKPKRPNQDPEDMRSARKRLGRWIESQDVKHLREMGKEQGKKTGRG